MKYRFSVYFLCFLALTACSTYTVEPEPTIPVPLTIRVVPSLSYWQQAIHDCTRDHTETSILIDNTHSGQGQSSSINWTIHPGETDSPRNYALGEDQTTIIVHPDNPISELSASNLAGIYTGFIDSWGEVQPNLPDPWGTRSIQPLLYFQDDEFGLLFEDKILAGEIPSLDILRAPSPADTIQYVMSNPGAIGVIPHKWLISSVKAVKTDLTIQFPILLSMQEDPDEIQKAFIACLQGKAK